MRMAAGRGVTAADILNTWPVERLAQTFAELADERRAKQLGRAIVRRRATAAFATSDDFVNAIRETLGPRSGRPHFARLFQALRIVVNQELEQLERALPALRATLVPGGRTPRLLRDRDPGGAGPAVRAAALRTPVPGAPDRGEPGARAARAGAPGPARDPRAGRPDRRDHVPFRRGPHRQACVPRVGQAVRLSAGAARLHLPRSEERRVGKGGRVSR